jgi:hypothetical protein
MKPQIGNDILFRENVLGSELTALIVYPSSENYESVKRQFNISGHAFLIHEEKMIVVDGTTVSEDWFTEDHLQIIFAHELGHFLACHATMGPGQARTNIEREADFLGIKILKERGSHAAHVLHLQEYQLRYGSSFKEDSDLLNKKIGHLVQTSANA